MCYRKVRTWITVALPARSLRVGIQILTSQSRLRYDTRTEGTHLQVRIFRNSRTLRTNHATLSGHHAMRGAIHAVNFIHDASHAISFGKSANWVVEMIELDPGEITQPSYPASTSRWNPPLSRKSGTHRRPCRCASMKLWKDPVTLPSTPSVPSDPTATVWQIINEVLTNVALTPALYPSLVLHASPQSILSLPSLLPLIMQPVPSHLLSFPVSL